MEYVYQTKFFGKTFLPEAQQPKTLLKRDVSEFPAPVPRKGEMVSIDGVKRMVMGITHTPKESRVYIELGDVR